MVHVSRHGNWKPGAGIRKWKQNIWHRYHDMETEYMEHVSVHGKGRIVQVSRHGNWTFMAQVGIGTLKQNTWERYQDMVHTTHGRGRHRVRVSRHGNFAHGTHIRT
jgi:hypothetical protein